MRRIQFRLRTLLITVAFTTLGTMILIQGIALHRATVRMEMVRAIAESNRAMAEQQRAAAEALAAQAKQQLERYQRDHEKGREQRQPDPLPQERKP